MRRLILHIGTEKTGTSSIQRFLARHRDRLAAQGVRTPASLADPAGNHSWLPLLAYDAGREDDLSRRWLDPRLDRQQQIGDRRRAFVAEVEACGSATWIISSEHLQSRLTTAAEIERLRQLLQPLFSEIRLLLYIRRPIATAVSLWSTAVQCGHPFSRLPAPDQPYWRNLCDHAATVRRWSAGFPGSPLQLRLFQRGDLVGGDVISDFLAATDLDAARRWPRPRRENPTLSHRGILLCAELNRRLPRPDDGRPCRLVSLIARASAFLPSYRASPAEEGAYDAAFGASGDWVRARHFPDRSRLWDADPARPAAGGEVRLSRLERGGIAALAALWRGLGLQGSVADDRGGTGSQAAERS